MTLDEYAHSLDLPSLTLDELIESHQRLMERNAELQANEDSAIAEQKAIAMVIAKQEIEDDLLKRLSEMPLKEIVKMLEYTV